MKPTRAQYFFAGSSRSWLLRVLFSLLFIGAPLYFACVVAFGLAHVYRPLSDIWNLLQVAFFAIVALFLAFLVALVAGSFLAGLFWPLLRPLYKARAIKNGAPFHVGDHVQILVGRHKGRVVRVYSNWENDSVRVELGEQEKEKSTDIFSDIELLRENVEPKHPGAGLCEPQQRPA